MTVSRSRAARPARAIPTSGGRRRTRSQRQGSSAAAPPTDCAAGALRTRRRARGWISSSARPGLLDDLRNPLQLVLRQARALTADERRDDLFRGAIEKRVDQMAQRRLARGATWQGRRVDVAKACFLVPHVPLLLEYAQLRAHGRRVRIAGKIRHDGRGGGASASIQDVHDLPLASGQAVERSRHVIFITLLLQE